MPASFLQWLRRRYETAASLATTWFLRLKYRRFAGRGAEEVFGEHLNENHWDGGESVSGQGSSLAQTAAVREALPGLIRTYRIRSLLDIPCGDFHWMQHVELDVEYLGADIVPDLVQANQERFAGPRRRFVLHDLLAQPPPRADLVLCRDLLVHFSFADIARALDHLRQSGSAYLLTTTFFDRAFNADIPTGGWRTLNLEQAPFNFPEPLDVIDERRLEDRGAYRDKHLALWRVEDLPRVDLQGL